MSKNLYIMVGAPGAGKSYWLEQNAKSSLIVSRDNIRLSKLKDEDPYFKYEDEVFEEYVATIQEYLWYDLDDIHVYADATQISAISRYKLIRNLELIGVHVHIIFIDAPINRCKRNNEKREGLRKIPDKAIDNMFKRLTKPTFEEYPYDSITEVKYRW